MHVPNVLLSLSPQLYDVIPTYFILSWARTSVSVCACTCFYVHIVSVYVWVSVCLRLYLCSVVGPKKLRTSVADSRLYIRYCIVSVRYGIWVYYTKKVIGCGGELLSTERVYFFVVFFYFLFFADLFHYYYYHYWNIPCSWLAVRISWWAGIRENSNGSRKIKLENQINTLTAKF